MPKNSSLEIRRPPKAGTTGGRAKRMIEVEMQLQFVTPCLGNVRCEDGIDRMNRMPSLHPIFDPPKVRFMPTWWKNCVSFGAKGLAKHQNRVRNIRWDPSVTGDLSIIERHYKDGDQTGIKKHEGFAEGAVIAVKAMLPDGLPIEDFRKIMNLGGTYVGISPYGHKLNWGRFKVVNIAKVGINSNNSSSGERNRNGAD